MKTSVVLPGYLRFATRRALRVSPQEHAPAAVRPSGVGRAAGNSAPPFQMTALHVTVSNHGRYSISGGATGSRYLTHMPGPRRHGVQQNLDVIHALRFSHL